MDRDGLQHSIALRVQDYRQGEWAGSTPQHVARWVDQFDPNVRDAVLAELNHLLEKVYVSRARMTSFLTNLATNTQLTNGDPRVFWQRVGILDIQSAGTSQREMIAEFDQILQKTLGYGVAQCASASADYIYLDDAIFTGTRCRTDIEKWLADAPPQSHIHVIVLGLHMGGKWHIESKVREIAHAAGKQVHLTFWRLIQFEDRLAYSADSDVLRPSVLPTDPFVQSYEQQITLQGFASKLRSGSRVGEGQMFSSPAARDLFENEMLKKGAYIRQICPNLPDAIRPLGYTRLRTLGFGGTLVTYRNCPNNCPLAYWVSNPWYPLFPRRTNAPMANRGAVWI